MIKFDAKKAEIRVSSEMCHVWLTDHTTIEKALEFQFGDSHLIQFYRTELKTRRQKTSENLQAIAADVERLMSLVYAECLLDVRESLAAQYYVDAIRHTTCNETDRFKGSEISSSI
ncbi:hypothetical protein AVEN_49529-1 [Araneus ventricosus]|uniref:Uncharacterized protein n=1 Tax=Araneus ventricosus TaxID=182803 RepID=A0A4Y2WLU2_ARAVE|nr:hypothetical protein AVEN_49529-1 [Araneus ventricosus]